MRAVELPRWKNGINWTLPPHKDEAFAWERAMLGDPFLQVLSFYFSLKIDPIKTWPSSYSDKSFLTCGSFEALSEMSTSTPGTSISTLMTNWIFFGIDWDDNFLLIWLFITSEPRLWSNIICLHPWKIFASTSRGILSVVQPFGLKWKGASMWVPTCSLIEMLY